MSTGLRIAYVWVLCVAGIVGWPGPALAVEGSVLSAVKIQQRADAMLARVLSVAQLDPGQVSPMVEVRLNFRFALASVAGQPGRIVGTPKYFQSIGDDALLFAIAHEVAHLQLSHHNRLQHLSAAGLSSEPTQDRKAHQKSLMELHHDIEFEADQLAMQWCRQLSECTVEHAREALDAAYGGVDRQTHSHPSLSARMQALKAATARERYNRAMLID